MRIVYSFKWEEDIMILDNVNPNDLFPTEKRGPSVLGIIEYQVQKCE